MKRLRFCSGNFHFLSKASVSLDVNELSFIVYLNFCDVNKMNIPGKKTYAWILFHSGITQEETVNIGALF